MKSVAASTNWLSRSHQRESVPEPLTPSYIAPRSAPNPPSQSFKSVFQRKTLKPPSVYSTSTTTSSDTHSSHPYSAPTMPPLPVVSSHSSPDDDDECPVCLESLSFSFRLPGEKPHIVPECGHSLHEACFTAVYGTPPRGMASKSNLGVCGVCRRPMKVGDGDSGKSNKLAALTGMGDSRAAPLYPGRDTPTNRVRQPQRPYDPTADDPLEVMKPGAQDHAHYIVTPSIQVRPEFPSLTRTTDVSQPLTCIVIIELPGKRAAGNVPGAIMSDRYMRPDNGSGHSSPLPDQYQQRDHQNRRREEHHPPHAQNRRHEEHQPSHAQNRRREEPSHHQPSHSHFNEQQYSDSSRHNSGNYASNTLIHSEADSPFTSITEDLRNRIVDWKGHPLSDLGPLQMYDLLHVRRDAAIREFYVYLFKEAIICVVEEKKRGLGRLLSNASGMTDTTGSGSMSGGSKGVLRLKGRIYVRHIKNLIASSAAGEMSLTIDMEDELASFILVFKERSSLESWRNNIQALINMFQEQSGVAARRAAAYDSSTRQMENMDEFGGSSKAMRMLSGSTQTTVSTVDSLLHSSSRSSSTSQSSVNNMRRDNNNSGMYPNKLATLGEDDELSAYDSPSNLVSPHMSAGPSNSLPPLPHTPIDVIMVVSIPPPNSVPSTAQLKVRVIKATLDFLLASFGPKDRMSLITFEVGPSGKVRKTPFLSVANPHSRQRLEKFIDEIGQRFDDHQEEFLVRGSKEEKTDVVTAVNHGLDVVLQRKARNSISAMMLISDASDSTRRAQMDLVLARAEAANVPIHSFGYGRSHDPASLWLMSNHTGGTYTFVKDWYDLRDCVAGCVGGLMSVGLLGMKVHVKIVDGLRFRIRKVSGGPQSILSSDGQHVDVDVSELRYGERKEILIELELDNTDQQKLARMQAQRGRAMSATDAFVHAMGLDSLGMDDNDEFADGMMDRMIDEVPVVEVDASYFDPAVARSVSRLAHPVLLTITILPLPSPGSPPRPQPTASDTVILRRRMELLASDMVTRALVLVSRNNFTQAQRIMGETKRILHTVLQNVSRNLPAPSANSGAVRNRKEVMTLAAVRAIQSILQDLQVLADALEDNVELFGHDHRNFGAQQAMILRDQKSWNGRSATERLFWTVDNSIELVSRSTDWIPRD